MRLSAASASVDSKEKWPYVTGVDKYNSAPAAGASQPHKHLRLVPLPLGPLRLPIEPLLVTTAPLGFEASSALAQGGIAASLGADDNASLHLADTLAAGDGLCDQAVASAILASAPAAIEQLMQHGVEFDRDIIVEIFPKKQDFGVRTFGLPWAEGFLGVCFGPVITAVILCRRNMCIA